MADPITDFRVSLDHDFHQVLADIEKIPGLIFIPEGIVIAKEGIDLA